MKLYHIQLALVFSLPTPHLIVPMCTGEHPPPHPHMLSIITTFVTIQRKNGLSFVSWDYFCLFKVILTGHVTENLCAK